MAYRQPANPDALPWFAEPDREKDRKPAAAPPQTQTQPQYAQTQYSQAVQPPRPLQSHRQTIPIPPAGRHPDPAPSPVYGSYHSPPSVQHNMYSPISQPGSFPAAQAAVRSPHQPPQGYGYGYGGIQSPPPGALPPLSTLHHGHGNITPRVSSGSHPNPGQGPLSPASNLRPDFHDSLWPIFNAVDREGRGSLTERELGSALVNGDFRPFDHQTVRMMIRMFDGNRSGTISFDEFCGLWSFLSQWRTLFDRFDTDRSGNISLPEFRDALLAFRYRLSDRFVDRLFDQYDKRGERHLSFDLFVQASIALKRMTDSFKKFDEDRDGIIQLTFEEFLDEILRQMR